jgi:phycoerythrobilin:ferredoxin oxidoreductase
LGHRHPLGPSKGPTLLQSSGSLLLLLFIIATFLDLSEAWVVTPTWWRPSRTRHGRRQSFEAKWGQIIISRRDTRDLLASTDSIESDEDDLTGTVSAVGLYAPFARAVWERWEATGWFNSSTITQQERYAEAKGFPPGSQVRMTVMSMKANRNNVTNPVAYARFALLETLVTKKNEGTATKSVEQHAGIQVLNAVVIPRVGSSLPVWGADFVALPGNKHLLLLDAQPMTEATEKIEDSFAPWYRTHDIANKWPRAGDLPPDVERYVSPMALWTRLIYNETDKDAELPTRKIAQTLLPVMQDHLDTYVEMLGYDINNGGESWLKPYLEYRLAKDPARSMLQSLYGKEWTEDTLQSMLFPIDQLFSE